MAKIKKGDFIEIEYTGRIKGGVVFDTTKEDVARQQGIYNKNASYKPITLCVGESHLLKGIDEQVEGKEPGKHSFQVPPEKGFGKKSPKLLQLISTSKFRSQGVMPVPGMQVNIDGIAGIVKTVTGGRTIVDFNHPLAGKDIEYEVEIKRIVTDEKEKVDALLNLMGLSEFETVVASESAEITLKGELPDDVKEKITQEIIRLTSIKAVALNTAAPAEKPSEKGTQKDKPADSKTGSSP